MVLLWINSYTGYIGAKKLQAQRNNSRAAKYPLRKADYIEDEGSSRP